MRCSGVLLWKSAVRKLAKIARKSRKIMISCDKH